MEYPTYSHRLLMLLEKVCHMHVDKFALTVAI